MKRTIMLVPIGKNIGLTTISLGLIEKIKSFKLNIKFLKSIFECSSVKQKFDNTSEIIKKTNFVSLFDPIKINRIDELLLVEKKQEVIDHILLAIKSSDKHFYDVLLIEGIYVKSLNSTVVSHDINYDIAQSIKAEIIFVCSIERDNNSDIEYVLFVINNFFKNKLNIGILGIIINELIPQTNNVHSQCLNLFDLFQNSTQQNDFKTLTNYNSFFKKNDIQILGYIPWNIELLEPTVHDIFYHYFKSTSINQYNTENQYIKKIFVYDEHEDLSNKKFFCSLLIISVVSINLIKQLCKKVKNNIQISAILLTNFSQNSIKYEDIIDQLKTINSSVFFTKENVLTVILLLHKFNFKSFNQVRRLNKIKRYLPQCFDSNWIHNSKTFVNFKHKVSSFKFIYNLKILAKKSLKKILLPEGNELRIIKAASICSKNNLAHCTLLGKPKEILRIALLHNVKLDSNIDIIDPTLIRKNYLDRFVFLRKKKGMTLLNANELIKNDSILSTLMLESRQFDGLVSGSVNTTANIILPALQLIKTSQNSSLVSSVFFMLLRDQVLLYSDCAVNPSPNSDQLAEIAIQSANTANLFGIFPKIAMLSYATGDSSSGFEIEKVKKAKQLVIKFRPDLIIDGPIQYDAAINQTVSKLKLVNSSVLGEATVFIFPDLNSGNITYKAVQNSAHIISIGPILQGINQPVNDLSRGSTVQDIVYTIVVTAIQSNKVN